MSFTVGKNRLKIEIIVFLSKKKRIDCYADLYQEFVPLTVVGQNVTEMLYLLVIVLNSN